MTTHPLQEFPFASLVELPAFLAWDPDNRKMLTASRRQLFFQAITPAQYITLRHDIRLSIGFGKLEDHRELEMVTGMLNGYSTFATEEEADEADENREMYVGHWIVGWDGLNRPLFTNADTDELRKSQVMRPSDFFPPFYEKMCSVLMDYLNGRLHQTGWRTEYHETITTKQGGELIVNSPVPLTGFELGQLSLGNQTPFQMPIWKHHPTFQL